MRECFSSFKDVAKSGRGFELRVLGHLGAASGLLFWEQTFSHFFFLFVVYCVLKTTTKNYFVFCDIVVDNPSLFSLLPYPSRECPPHRPFLKKERTIAG